MMECVIIVPYFRK